MAEPELRSRLEHHVEMFNEAVRTGDFGDFLASFAEDAVMQIDGAAAGPVRGRAAIAEAYRDAPPADTMALMAMETDGEDAVRASFDWDNQSGGGQMYLRWQGSQLAELVVSFA
jgi:steroid Delta-isomerase